MTLNDLQRWLVADWKRAWRWWSVQMAALSALLQTAVVTWQSLPAELRAALPEAWVQGFAILTVVLSMLGRVLAQNQKGTGDGSE